MKSRNKLLSILIVITLFLPVIAAAEVDHIHFGSKDNPLQGLTITWRGNYSHCKIKWGYTTSYEQGESGKIEGRIEFGDKCFYLYDYTFPQMKASAVIHYSFQECTGPYDKSPYTGDWTKDYTFQTSTTIKSECFTFIAGGDSRGDSVNMEKWGEAAETLKNTNADFYLYMGDLSLQGGDKQMWESWYKEGNNFISKKLIYHQVGNHERYGDPYLFNYLNQLVMPENGNFTELYYSFEFGNAVFIILNTEFSHKNEKGIKNIDQQTRWLRDELRKYRGNNPQNYKEWVIISFHKPFFTIDKHMGEMTGGPGEEDPTGLAKYFYHDFSYTWWKGLFDKYGVDVIINGHTHTYMRSEPLLLVGNGADGGDITFDSMGFPTKPKKTVDYGNKKDQGRLQIITGGFGAHILGEDKLKYKCQWYVDNYKTEYHYCEFKIDGKELLLEVRRIKDNKIIDKKTIKHE